MQEIEQQLISWSCAQSSHAALEASLLELARPEGRDRVSYQLLCHAAGHLLTDGRSVTSCLHRWKDDLSPLAAAMLGHWQIRPMQWSAFMIVHRWQYNLFTIRDLFTSCEMLLYSVSLSDLADPPGTGLYLALLYHNGSCRQVEGLIHHYPLHEQDLLFFFRGLSPGLFDEQGIDRLIDSRFTSIWYLDQLDIYPDCRQFVERTALYYRILSCPLSWDQKLPGCWERSCSGPYAVLRYLGPDRAAGSIAPAFIRTDERHIDWHASSPADPEILFDIIGGRLCVRACSLHDYMLLMLIIGSVHPLPLEQITLPEAEISLPLCALCRKIEGFTYPWDF